MSTADHDFRLSYLKTVIHKFMEVKELAEKAMNQLPTAESWLWKPDDESNSIAIIVKHMSGNMVSRWTDFLVSDGEKPSRKRDEEFEVDSLTPGQIMSTWETGWQVFLDALQSLKAEDLERTIMIRNKPHTVLDAIERQMSHYSYHVGQIAYIAKSISSSNWRSLSIPKRST